jgi:thiol-disulfide isomerase/thioredoxin
MSTGPMALPSPARAGNEVSERRIILLGARWCAPCMAEWRNLPRLAAMVAPDRIVLAWIDRPIPVPPALAPQVSAAPVVEAQALAVKYGGQGFGLPMATIIDGRDKACAVWRRPLHPENVKEFYQACLEH